ncbi:MAG TPA: bifunctional 3-deoxy-7-phosphoheptulonate synthase/chorismate mutase type II [Bacteroidales bacterium]|nr:bifunctional 3-deoxy-7-phosphoheptulonate synthase/chorismate mutase type II [Bacteroidales bacterium]
MKIIPIKNWFGDFESDPLIIAGPCSAESEEQVMETAALLKATYPPAVFRSGLWKPRTRPGSFNGIGHKGMRWLRKVKEEFGFRIAVEAAIPKHIEECLKGDVDIIWIGARTSSNPYSIEEIAAVLKGVDIPVLVKNPLTPDIDLWIGAIERIYSAGINKIAAVHRGFSPFERTVYRNMPKWEIPIELRRRYRDLPVICDPSHISGDASLVPEVAQRAMDLNMSGLMIEVHYNPSEALSDSRQQLKPDAYSDLMNNLIIRKARLDDPVIMDYLEELRDQVDSIDHQLIELLSRRMELSDLIGEHKCKNNMAVLQMERWLEILKTRISQARKMKVGPNFTENFLKLVHEESIRRQTEVMGKLRNKGKCSGDDSVDN